jgi:hypothetical protein
LFAFLAICTLQVMFASQAGAQTGVVAFSQATYSVAEGNTQAIITLVRTGDASETGTVDFATTGGTASNGLDYIATNGTMTFLPGILTNTFNIGILSNPALNTDRTVNLALEDPTGPVTIGSLSNAVLTILAQQLPLVAFIESEYSITETNTNAIITLIRTGNTSGTGTVDFAAAGGTASNGVDYTATTGTVTFLPGIISNTFSVTILGDTNLDTDETVNLQLKNPTGSLSLGSPSNAVLTILDQGPTTFDFSAPSYRVLRHIGAATVTVLRKGQSGPAVDVTYATAAGTAINGTDYLDTGAGLNFASGDIAKSFSFTVLRNNVLSNRTVNVVLSNPTGVAVLGSQSNAVVIIVNDQRETVTLTDDDNDLVTMTLQKAGTMEVTQDISGMSIVLNGTDAQSTLTIKVKRGTVGDGLVKISAIQGDGGCGRIDAPAADLVGTGIILTNFLGSLRVHDITNGVAIVAGGTEDQSTTISAHNIDDGVSIDLGSRIKTLNAARFGNGTITAPSIGTMTIKGDKRHGISGDCEGLITLTGPGVPTNNITLGKLSVAGAITHATICIETGNVGTVKASRMVDSSLYVSFTPSETNNPLAGGVFVSNLVVRAVSITATSNAFVNSYIAAAEIGSVRLRSVATDNGAVPFGVLANQSISAVSVKNPPFNWKPANGNDQSLGDFHVKY